MKPWQTFLRPVALLLLVGSLAFTSLGCDPTSSGTSDTSDTTDVTGGSDETEPPVSSDHVSTDPNDYIGTLFDQEMKSKVYTVQYQKDGEWVEYDAMSTSIMTWNGWSSESGTGAYANIRTEEEELRIRVRRAGTRDWTIRPMENVSDFVDKGTTVEFTIKNGSFVSIEPSGYRTKNLLLRVSEPARDASYTGDVECTNVIRLGPGIHDFDNCDFLWLTSGMPTLRLKSGDHLILEEGAVLRAKVVANKAENIAITGTGIIDMTEWNEYSGQSGSPFRADAINFTECSNIYVGEVTVRNSAFFCLRGNQISNIEVDGFTAFSAVFEGDGIDFHGAIGAKISNCFLRNSDDCIALYPDLTDIRDIDVTNCVLWSDRAHTINMGTHGSRNPEDRHYIENVTFKDIDILDCNCPSVDYQGVIGISLGDESICQNLLFENIRIDDFTDSQVFVLKVMMMESWNSNPGYRIENIILRNIIFNGDNKNGSTIIGYDAERITTDITIEDFYINGEKMTSLQAAGIRVNEFTSNITIK